MTLALSRTNAYWITEDFITTERLDPVVSPGKVSSHVHSGSLRRPIVSGLRSISFLVLGGSNFRFNTSTEALRQSECTSIPIPEDKSNYWFPVSFSSLSLTEELIDCSLAIVLSVCF